MQVNDVLTVNGSQFTVLPPNTDPPEDPDQSPVPAEEDADLEWIQGTPVQLGTSKAAKDRIREVLATKMRHRVGDAAYSALSAANKTGPDDHHDVSLYHLKKLKSELTNKLEKQVPIYELPSGGVYLGFRKYLAWVLQFVELEDGEVLQLKICGDGRDLHKQESNVLISFCILNKKKQVHRSGKLPLLCWACFYGKTHLFLVRQRPHLGNFTV
jgi:hypothetical protein